jgi:hypothetical protein
VGIVTDRDVSAPAPRAPPEILNDLGAGGGNRTPDPARMNGEKDCAKPTIASDCNTQGGAGADRETPCFSLSPDDSSRIVTSPEEPPLGGVEVAASVDLAPHESIERVLARALARAADAGRWELVAQLAHELQARRLDNGGTRG